LDFYVISKSIDENWEARRIYVEGLVEITNAYQRLLKWDISPEDARYILPIVAKTNIVITMNTRELRHLFNLQGCERAQ
jgi:thymidylate synthase (FAD)